MKVFTCSLLLVLAVSLQADWKSTGDVLVSGNGATGSNFGYSVDVGKKYAVVGAKDEGSGAAYVFQKEDNGSWTKQMQLPNPISPITTSGFGASVAIAESSALNANPDFIVVGAPESYTIIGGMTFYRGEICIYERNSTTNLWEQHQECMVETSSNTLGFSVDASNYTEQGLIVLDSLAKIVAGDPGNDTNKTNAGAVYFYDYNTSSDTWSLNETAYAPEEQDASTTIGMHFGYSVALYGDISIIGAPYADTIIEGVQYADVGAAYFYNTNGVKIQEIYGFAGGLFNQENNLGLSVDISYDNAIIGARGGNMYPNGYATVYDYNGSGWEANGHLQGSTIDNDNEDFAYSVAIKGNHIAVGAPKKSVGGLELGAVYIYDKNVSGAWEESTHDYGAGNSLFGNSVSLYGDTLMVGAPGSEEVQVYDYSEPMGVNPALIMYLLN